jgi:hypothetical protein
VTIADVLKLTKWLAALQKGARSDMALATMMRAINVTGHRDAPPEPIENGEQWWEDVPKLYFSAITPLLPHHITKDVFICLFLDQPILSKLLGGGRSAPTPPPSELKGSTTNLARLAEPARATSN